MNSTQLCRLCLETSAGLINIFEKFQDSTIASVLAEHFWFQINKNDGMSEWVCETCWNQTKIFHDFYKKLELLHQNFLNSIVLVKVDEIKSERSVSPIGEAFEADLFVCKNEYETDTPIKADDRQTLSKESSWNEDDKDESCDQSEAEQTTDDDHESALDNPINAQHSRSKREEQDAEIRRFFKIKCEICNDNVEFDTFKKMRKHFRQVHKRRGYLICCGAQYRSRWSMLDHVQYHVNPGAHRCDQCGKSFRNRMILRNHVKSHERVHECMLCSKTYSSAAVLRYHVRDKHSTDRSVKLHCDICGKTYPTKVSLTGHIRNVHIPLPKHVCEVCGRKFKNKPDLLIHKKVEHSATPLPKVQCDICGKWLKHECRLQQHLRMHKNKNIQAQSGNVLNCPICKKEVKTKLLLGAHVRHSHGERKHQCTFCDKAFTRAKVLKEHIAVHTGVDDLYSCLYCDRTFRSSSNMYKHRKKAHLAEWTTDRAEKNSCHQVEPSETAITSSSTMMDE